MLVAVQRAGATCQRGVRPSECALGGARERSRGQTWLALAACLLVGGAAGCSDDGDPLSEAQSRGVESNSTEVIGGLDAGPVAPTVKVTNVGATCLTALDCHGPSAQCLEISLSGAFYAGGYCTAECKSSVECGPGAECPVGESELINATYPFRSTWARKCFKSCSPGDPNACRLGFTCKSLADAYEASDAPAPLHNTVCIPHLPTLSWDAGT